jgi:hypothetical protein
MDKLIKLRKKLIKKTKPRKKLKEKLVWLQFKTYETN